MISVIITTYKRHEFLINAINSVLNQTYQDFEIIVVDDNGKDSPYRLEIENIMKGYEDNCKITYLKYDTNKGACYARNYGINHSNGEYIAFLDDDDEFYPDKLKELIEKFVTNDIGIACSKMDIFDAVSDKFLRKSRFKGKETVRYSLNDFFKDKVVIQGTSTLMFTRDSLEKVNGFTEIPSHQEAYLILKVLKAGYLAVVSNETLVKYRDHSNDKKSVGKSNKAELGRKIYYEYYLKLINELENENDKRIALYYYHYLNCCYWLDKNCENAKKELKKMLSCKIFKLNTLKILIKWLMRK